MRARTLDDEHRLAAILPLRVNPIEVELREQSLPSGLDVEGKERGVQTCRTDGHELAHADAAGKLNRGCLIHSMLLSNVHTCYITRGTGALEWGSCHLGTTHLGLLRVWLTSGLLHGCGGREDIDHGRSCIASSSRLTRWRWWSRGSLAGRCVDLGISRSSLQKWITDSRLETHGMSPSGDLAVAKE